MGNDEDLEKISLQRNLENAERELKAIGEAKQEQLGKRELFVRALECKKLMHARAQELFIRQHADWAFLQDADYLGWQKELSNIEFTLEMMKNEGTLKEIDKNLAVYDEQLKSQAENIAATKKRLEVE